ncbi:GntR family transcriptional regulator [Jatrophihabitans sp. YIM 134969]
MSALRDRILSGQAPGGSRLGEVELARELGMSRTPVRQALLRLAAEGLVEVAPNRGARVIVRSERELEYVFELRARLEGLAARRSATRATPEHLDLLDKLAAEIAVAAERRDMDQVTRLNGQFHGLLIEIADSATLAAAVGGLLHASVLARTQSSFDEAAHRRSSNHHIEIVAALRANDPDWAESVMRSHLLSARASLLGPRRRPDEPDHDEDTP